MGEGPAQVLLVEVGLEVKQVTSQALAHAGVSKYTLVTVPAVCACIYADEFQVRVYHGHQYNGECAFVIKEEGTGVHRCFNNNMLSVQSSHTLWELPLAPEVCRLYQRLLVGL